MSRNGFFLSDAGLTFALPRSSFTTSENGSHVSRWNKPASAGSFNRLICSWARGFYSTPLVGNNILHVFSGSVCCPVIVIRSSESHLTPKAEYQNWKQKA